MIYTVTHSSEYRYSTPAALSLNEACLTARRTPFQALRKHTFQTEPAADYHRDRVDWFGNHWRLYAFEKPHRRLEIVSTQEVAVERNAAGDGVLTGYEPFLLSSPFVRVTDSFAAYGRDILSTADLPSAVADLTRKIFSDFAYDPEATEIGTPVEEFFRNRRGVCQDYAHLMIAVLRSCGVPARYVSGYLNTQPPPGKKKVWGADASHAWVAAWFPHQGWIDFDPTNGILVAEDHITLAWGRDYGDVTPLKGVVLGGGRQTLEVKVTVL